MTEIDPIRVAAWREKLMSVRINLTEEQAAELRRLTRRDTATPVRLAA